MALRSRDDNGVERALLIDGAPDDLRWIHPDVKMTAASLTWRHGEMIKDMEQAYRTKEGVTGVEFEPVEADERACSYDTERFVMFYGDVLQQLRVGPPFTHFQAALLDSLGVCPTQLTWNAWAFVLCFETVCAYLEVEPSPASFLFFFSTAQSKNGGWTHFLQRTDRVIIKNMRTSVRTWKNSFVKACIEPGYHPFFLDKLRRPLYPLRWSPPVRNEDWGFESLRSRDQDVVVRLLSAAPLDAQEIISKFARTGADSTEFCCLLTCFISVQIIGLAIRRSTFLAGKWMLSVLLRPVLEPSLEGNL